VDLCKILHHDTQAQEVLGYHGINRYVSAPLLKPVMFKLKSCQQKDRMVIIIF
jgi:hypothetical protein